MHNTRLLPRHAVAITPQLRLRPPLYEFTASNGYSHGIVAWLPKTATAVSVSYCILTGFNVFSIRCLAYTTVATDSSFNEGIFLSYDKLLMIKSRATCTWCTYEGLLSIRSDEEHTAVQERRMVSRMQFAWRSSLSRNSCTAGARTIRVVNLLLCRACSYLRFSSNWIHPQIYAL